MHRQKILHLIQSLDNGGCENMLLRTLPLVDNFEHILITLNKEGELSGKFREKGFEIINIKQNSLINPLPYLRLIETVKKIKPDAIITYLFHADIIGRIIIQLFTKYRPIPFLRTTYNHPKYWIARLTERLTKCFVKQYLANSESVKNFYVENIGVDKEKITVIPNGIDVNFYDNIERDWELRRSFGINDADFVIICVSNLHINKGHRYLLEAFENVFCHSREDGNPEPHLLLVGDGDEMKNLLRQVENYQSKNNVLFLGKRNDVPELLKISDIFVLPTMFEGMSNAIMEAMACGLPIVTTDIPENRELIENAQTGILIPPKNSETIYAAIKALLKNREFGKKLSSDAKLFVEKNLALNKIADRWNFFLNNHT